MRTVRLVPLLIAGLAGSLAACGQDSSTPLPGTTSPDQGVVDDATVPVPDAAPVASTVLTLDSPAEGAWVTARRLEVHGTYTGSPASITVNGRAAVLASGRYRAVVDLQPGDQTITVVSGETQLVVHFTVDPVPPSIDITAPSRGTWASSASVPMAFEVHDDNGLTDVMLNDRALPGGGPGFSVDAPLAEGLNILQVKAHDLAGNVSEESVAALSGPTRDPALPVNGALRVKIGAHGLAGISAEAARRIDALDLRTFLPPDPINAAGVEILLQNVTHAPGTTITLTPQATELGLALHISQLAVDVQLTLNGNPYPITLHADGVDVTGVITPGVNNGKIEVGVADLALNLTHFGVDLTGIPPFGGNEGEEQSMLETFLESLATNLAGEIVPGLLDTALGDFDATKELTLLDVAFRISVIAEQIVVQPDGLAIRAGAAITLVNPPANPPAAPGYLGRISGWDGVPTTDDVAVAVDDDLINLLLFQFWQSGAVLPTIDHAWLAAHPSAADLVTGFLGGLVASTYPDVDPTTPLRITTELALPPVLRVVQAETGAGLSVGIGDLGVHIATDNAARRDLIDGVASLLLQGAASVGPGADGKPAVHVDLGQLRTTFDVTNESLRGEVEASVEGPVASILESVGDALPGLLGGIPLPSLGGLPVSTFTVGVESEATDFLRVEAILTP